VSATAPYRHFPSKRCLLAALITRGFRALERAIREASDAAGSDPLRRLQEAGMGYLEFARDNPTSYHLMFSPVIGDFTDYEDVKRASEDAYGVVLGILDDVLKLPDGPPLAASQAGGIVWAAVHGLASLLLFGRDRMASPRETGPLRSLADLERNPRRALELLLLGMAPGDRTRG
jgi:AcrR family transcriptional regulator